MGSGDGSVVERWTHHRSVSSLNPSRSSRRIFFSRVNLLCWLLFRYPFHPCVNAIAWKRFCQKCRRQAAAKHTCTQRMWLQIKGHCKLVHGCMFYTEFAPRQQQFHVAPAVSPLSFIFKACCVTLQSLTPNGIQLECRCIKWHYSNHCEAFRAPLETRRSASVHIKNIWWVTSSIPYNTAPLHILLYIPAQSRKNPPVGLKLWT